MALLTKGPDGVVRKPEKKEDVYWDGSIDQDIPTSGLAEMFNCQFFLTAQCNPHIVPFFHSPKGDVATPSRWVRGQNEDSWRGGFLLAAVERYLKNDMKSKFHFLNDLKVAVGFTSTMMTQIYHGSTTIVPKVSISDYFVLFSNPSLQYLNKCFKVGKVAAYKHCAMMKLHFQVANALDRCLAILEHEDGSATKPRRRIAELAKAKYYETLKKVESRESLNGRPRGFSIYASVPFQDDFKAEDLEFTLSESDKSNAFNTSERSRSSFSESSSHDDECELGGFDGVPVEFVPPSF